MHLLDDYQSGRAELLRRYAVPPGEFPFLPPFPAAWDKTLADAINDAQERLGSSGRITADSYVVATGQQPGILTGPLYTVLKAVSAIQRAKAFELASGKPCIPLFWVASDDHDFEEVRTVHLLTRDHEALSLAYAPERPQAGSPMYAMRLSPTLHQLIDTAAAVCMNSEQTESIKAFLHASLDCSVSVSDWFARIMARLFRDTPLVIFAPDFPAARTLAAPVFAREIADPLATTRAINRAGRHIEAMGYTPPVRKHETECSFFISRNGRRCKVTYDGRNFMLPELSGTLSKEQMSDLLETAPEQFSANVALRPIVQQSLFPVVAYVGGPAEVAYWGQFKEVFERYQLAMPAVLPRAMAVLTTLKLSKLMTRLGISLRDLETPPEKLLDGVLRNLSASALQTLETPKTEFLTALSSLIHTIEAMATRSPEAKRAAEQFDRQVHQALDRLELSLLRADEKMAETARKQLRRLGVALYPEGMPQERYYCIFSWLFEYGWGLIPKLLSEIDPEKSTMQEIML